MSCCGSKRLLAAQNATPMPRPQSARPNPAAGNTGGAAPPGLAAGTTSARGMTQPMLPFVYDGEAVLVVVGPASGRRYRFIGRGARQTVDPRDADALRATPKLRCLA